MSTTQDDLLQSIRGVVGEVIDGRLTQLEKRIDARFHAQTKQMDVRFAAVEKQMDVRFAAVEKRFAAVEKQMDVRFAAVEKRFAAVEKRFDSLREEMLEGFRKQGEYLSKAIADAVHLMAASYPTKEEFEELREEVEELKDRLKKVERLQHTS